MPTVRVILRRAHHLIDLVISEISIQAQRFVVFGYRLPKSHGIALIPEITKSVDVPKYVVEEYRVSHPISNRCHTLRNGQMGAHCVHFNHKNTLDLQTSFSLIDAVK